MFLHKPGKVHPCRRGGVYLAELVTSCAVVAVLATVTAGIVRQRHLQWGVHQRAAERAEAMDLLQRARHGEAVTHPQWRIEREETTAGYGILRLHLRDGRILSTLVPSVEQQ